MKIKINVDEFKNGLKKCAYILPKKSKLEIIENILLSAKDNEVNLIATDLVTEVSIPINALIEEPGEVIITKDDIKIIQKLKGEISIEADEKQVTYKGNNTLKSFVKHIASEFPKGGPLSHTLLVEIKPQELKEYFKIKRMVSKDNTRQFLTGIHFNTKTMESSDGYRLTRIQCNYHNPDPFILPLDVVNILEKLIDKSTKLIEFYRCETNLTIISNCFTVNCKVMDHDFFNVNSIIKGGYKYTINIKKEDVTNYMNLATALKSEKPIVKLTLTDNELTFHTELEAQNISRKFKVKPGSREFKSAYNPIYWMEALRCIKSKEIQLNFNEPLDPMVINAPGEEYLILPIRMSR